MEAVLSTHTISSRLAGPVLATALVFALPNLAAHPALAETTPDTTQTYEAVEPIIAMAVGSDAGAGEDPDAYSAPLIDERRAFVSEWAPRIDAYLAGSPLAGHGETFAEAAYEYGVDPRWSPAISCIESSKGAACFRSHNAWGWGNASWGSWEEAIWAHVAGLAAGYGSTNSISAAAKYCPPNYQSWYANVESEMSRI